MRSRHADRPSTSTSPRLSLEKGIFGMHGDPFENWGKTVAFFTGQITDDITKSVSQRAE
jgi:hypothetical protein